MLETHKEDCTRHKMKKKKETIKKEDSEKDRRSVEKKRHFISC